jgi:predicted N-formylglutamate amidohydrolase
MTQSLDPPALLGPDDPEPVALAGEPLAPGPLVLLGDHAGRLFPRRLGDMGLAAGDRHRHIALDLGIEPLGRLLSQRLTAPFVSQTYSRLVADCNRAPDSAGVMPPVSDGTAIPANRALTAAERAERLRAIHEPYHRAIAALLNARADAGLPSVVVALHSFTPALAGAERRVWDAGVLHGGPGDGYGRRVLRLLQQRPDGWVIGDNQPYSFGATDHTIARHAIPRALPWLELEVRQDHLATPAGIAAVADRLAPLLVEALAALAPAPA